MMDLEGRIEHALGAALDSLASPTSPPALLAATRQAVFPGGARIRPRLCLAVAWACGDAAPAVADAAGAAVELIHCASLVHDDLPCFDDAQTRRGLPSVHRAYGQAIAVLAGDQLIVLAFETLARGVFGADSHVPGARHAARLFKALARGVSMPEGIIAGQALESETTKVSLASYRRAKTGALFEASAVLGALAAGHNSASWGDFGQRIGEAYQVADDMLDLIGDPDEIGKPVGRDGALGRPNTVFELGLSGAKRLLRQLVQDALASVPACPRADLLRAWTMEVGEKLVGTSSVGASMVSDTTSA